MALYFPIFQRTQRSITFAFLVFLTAVSLAQNGLTHTTVVEQALFPCAGDGTIATGAKTITVPAGSKFSIVGAKDDDHVIRFWRWSQSSSQQALSKRPFAELTPEERAELARNKNFQFRIDPTTREDIFFRIPKASMGLYTEPVVSKFSPTAGAAVLPFKLRPQYGEFTKDLALSGLVGASFHPYRREVNSVKGLFGIGISSISLDSANTDGKVLQSSDRAAITISTGLVFEWEKVQLGLFLGWDHLNKSDRKLWVYQGAHWLALGIGVSIFSDEKDAVSDKQ